MNDIDKVKEDFVKMMLAHSIHNVQEASNKLNVCMYHLKLLSDFIGVEIKEIADDLE